MECSKLNHRKRKTREIGKGVSVLSDSNLLGNLAPEDVRIDENNYQRDGENASDIGTAIPDTCEVEQESVQNQASPPEGTTDCDFHLTSEQVQEIEGSDNPASMMKDVDDSAEKFQTVVYDCLRNIDCQLLEPAQDNTTTVFTLSGIKMAEFKNEYAPLKVSWDALTNLIHDDDYSLPTASNIDETKATAPPSDKEVPTDTSKSISTPPVSSKTFKKTILSKEFKNTSCLGGMKVKLLTLSHDTSAKHKVGIRSAEEGELTHFIVDSDFDLLWGNTWNKAKDLTTYKAEILSNCSTLREAKWYWKSKFAYNVVNKTVDGKFELLSRKLKHRGNDDPVLDYLMCELKCTLDRSELHKVGQERIRKCVGTAESEKLFQKMLTPSQAQVPESTNTKQQTSTPKNTMLRKISQWAKKITK